jgi:hypothetical protein
MSSKIIKISDAGRGCATLREAMPTTFSNSEKKRPPNNANFNMNLLIRDDGDSGELSPELVQPQPKKYSMSPIITFKKTPMGPLPKLKKVLSYHSLHTANVAQHF